MSILPRKVRAKKPSLPLNLGTNGLKVTSEPPPMAEQAGRLPGQDRSAVTCPSSGHVRRCLIRLSCDNRRTQDLKPNVKKYDEIRQKYSLGHIKTKQQIHTQSDIYYQPNVPYSCNDILYSVRIYYRSEIQKINNTTFRD
ncbi:hypothetical protein J6590_049521 [Homalodisca vitripennis]|nr:hypothetical protein J6590_049521 [Homalodisca vitripennis]